MEVELVSAHMYGIYAYMLQATEGPMQAPQYFNNYEEFWKDILQKQGT